MTRNLYDSRCDYCLNEYVKSAPQQRFCRDACRIGNTAARKRAGLSKEAWKRHNRYRKPFDVGAAIDAWHIV